jgi:cobalamin synthase
MHIGTCGIVTGVLQIILKCAILYSMRRKMIAICNMHYLEVVWVCRVGMNSHQQWECGSVGR